MFLLFSFGFPMVFLWVSRVFVWFSVVSHCLFPYGFPKKLWFFLFPWFSYINRNKRAAATGVTPSPVSPGPWRFDGWHGPAPAYAQGCERWFMNHEITSISYSYIYPVISWFLNPRKKNNSYLWYFYSYIYINHRFQPFIRQLNAIDWGPHPVTYNIWLVVSNIFYFSIYWEESSQLTFIFFKGVGIPPTRL